MIYFGTKFRMATMLLFYMLQKIQSYIFWNITPCSLLKVNRRFRGTCLYLQSWQVGQARNQQEDRSDIFSETSANTELTTQLNIPEEMTFHSHLCWEPQILQTRNYLNNRCIPRLKSVKIHSRARNSVSRAPLTAHVRVPAILLLLSVSN
jgi:hypothetical protein